MLFLLLSLIWGSSFILMKIGLYALSPYEVAAIRMLSAGLVLLPFCYQAFKSTPRKKIPYMLLSGLLGSFFPAILFCMAETSIHSAVAAILNATTPLFVVLVGLFFFSHTVGRNQWLGVGVGLAGVLLLTLPSIEGSNNTFTIYAALVMLATVMYGFNVNIVNRYLIEISPLYTTAISFVMLIPLDLVILWQSGWLSGGWGSPQLLQSLTGAFVLGAMGTAFATWIFYKLMQMAGPIFSSMVTYGIPFVAIGWGMLAGEKVGYHALFALILILSGVYLTYQKKSP
jgi:drug/metabolite transporter (DMT)-like permease